jgi:hypothetical protein
MDRHDSGQAAFSRHARLAQRPGAHGGRQVQPFQGGTLQRRLHHLLMDLLLQESKVEHLLRALV